MVDIFFSWFGWGVVRYGIVEIHLWEEYCFVREIYNTMSMEPDLALYFKAFKTLVCNKMFVHISQKDLWIIYWGWSKSQDNNLSPT